MKDASASHLANAIALASTISIAGFMMELEALPTFEQRWDSDGGLVQLSRNNPPVQSPHPPISPSPHLYWWKTSAALH